MKYKINYFKYIIRKIKRTLDCFCWILTKEAKKYRNKSLIYDIGYELRVIVKHRIFAFLLNDWKEYKENIWIDAVLSDCVKKVK